MKHGYHALARRVREHLGQDHRYAHSVRVARCAELLAMRHGIAPHRARMAGMLHDLARLYNVERVVRECVDRGMKIDAFEAANPIVLHARLGAHLAREQFGIEDAEILSAIEKHTVGAEEMTPLECAVYLADGLEPGRTFAERDAHWQLAQRDLHAAMRATLVSTITYLRGRGLSIAPQTFAAARTFDVPLEETEPSLNY